MEKIDKEYYDDVDTSLYELEVGGLFQSGLQGISPPHIQHRREPVIVHTTQKRTSHCLQAFWKKII